MMLASVALAWVALMQLGSEMSGRDWSGSLRLGQLPVIGRHMLEADVSSSQRDVHKPWAWSWQNILGMGLAFTVGALGNAVGIGGGAFFVPLGEVLLGFSLKGATALSQAIITGGAMASVVLALPGRHPSDPGKPLIDYGTALMLTPVLLLGVSIGVLLNVLFPDWLLTFLLTTLLLWLTARISLKACRLFKAEKTAAAAAAAAAGGTELPPRGRQAPPQQSSASGQAAATGQADPGEAERGSVPRRIPLERSLSQGGGPRRRVILRSDTQTQSQSGQLQLQQNQQPPQNKQQAGQAGHSPAEAPMGASNDGSKASAPSRFKTSSWSGLDGDGAGLKENSRLSERSNTVHGGMAFETVPAFGLDGAPVAPGPPSPARGSRQGGPADAPPPARQLSASRPEAASLPPRPPGAGSNNQDSSVRGGSVALSVASSGELRSASPPGGEEEGDPSHHSHHHTTHSEDGAHPRLPWLQLLEVLVLWGGFLGLQLGKGRLQRCSAPYYGIFACQVVLAVVANMLFTVQARRAALAAAQVGAVQPMLRAPGGVAYQEPSSWSTATLARCSLVAFVGGSIAGLLGIGGGMVIAPLLIELGLHPLVAAATSSLMVLFSASTAALAFAFEHLLSTTYALVFGIGCFVSSLLGVWVVGRLVRRSGRASYVVIILAAIIALGAVLTGVFGGRKAILALESGRQIGFNSFCSDS